jgi:diadenylate cyclase
MELVLEFINANWRSAVEILILAVLLYQLFASFKATRAARIGWGILIVVGGLYLISNLLKLEVIGLVLRGVLYVVGTGIVVLFQPELRRFLEKVSSRFFAFSERKSNFLEVFQETVAALANKRFGALFAFERGIDLSQVAETGAALDARFSKELLLTVFHPRTALHDGGVILKGERVVSAACVFPISQRQMIDRSIGLRHRAGLGITEETDAIAIIVSEETGQISICHGGRLEGPVKPADLAAKLGRLLAGPESHPAFHDEPEKIVSS